MVRILAGTRDSLFSKISISALGYIQPPIQWVVGFFARGNRHETDYSCLSTGEVKNACVHGMDRDFTFYRRAPHYAVEQLRISKNHSKIYTLCKDINDILSYIIHFCQIVKFGIRYLQIMPLSVSFVKIGTGKALLVLQAYIK
jgi:hypothetical protein